VGKQMNRNTRLSDEYTISGGRFPRVNNARTRDRTQAPPRDQIKTLE
jgi:hypothetical protein